jgi:hypothetical protein
MAAGGGGGGGGFDATGGGGWFFFFFISTSLRACSRPISQSLQYVSVAAITNVPSIGDGPHLRFRPAARCRAAQALGESQQLQCAQ